MTSIRRTAGKSTCGFDPGSPRLARNNDPAEAAAAPEDDGSRPCQCDEALSLPVRHRAPSPRLHTCFAPPGLLYYIGMDDSRLRSPGSSEDARDERQRARSMDSAVT